MRTLALWLLCALAGGAQLLQIDGGINVVSGTLKGDDGTVIVGGSVHLYRIPGSSPGRTREAQWSVVSGAEGAFRFANVGQGAYRLCAQAQDGTWLDPCDWGLGANTLAPAQNSSGVMLVMRKGTVVPVRIDDPGQLLSRPPSGLMGAGLLIGFGSDTALFHALSLASADSTGRSYQVVIPFDTAVKLIIASPFLQLADASGLLIPSGATYQVPVLVPSGGTPPLLHFVVTGASK